MIRRTFIMALLMVAINVAAQAKPCCRSFSNYDGKVTIVFTDDKPRKDYSVTDVKLRPIRGKSLAATSVSASVGKDEVTVTLTFPYASQFSNPKVTLRINGKKARFRVCH